MSFREILGTAIAILTACLVLVACGSGANADNGLTAPDKAAGTGKTEVIVLGMIHGRHRTSKLYPVSRIQAVVKAIDPDIVLTELPANRYEQALREFRETGKVREKRAQAFPEYIDAIIPLTASEDFELIGTAGWTPEIAAQRAAVLKKFETDPALAEQWQAYSDAQKAYADATRGKSDDPLFIHATAYDEAVRALYAPYVRYFDKDMGPAGWEAINRTHWSHIAPVLDRVKGQKKRVLITYGGFHKHKLLAFLKQRDDVVVIDPLPYFRDNPA